MRIIRLSLKLNIFNKIQAFSKTLKINLRLKTFFFSRICVTSNTFIGQVKFYFLHITENDNNID